LYDGPSSLDDPDAGSTAAHVFALLIKGHSQLARRAVARSGSPEADRFQRLLTNFAEVRHRAEIDGRMRGTADRSRFTSMLDRFRHARERHRDTQEAVADDFNLLDVLQLTGKEIRHSMVLAWLLDRDLEAHGTHAQGSLGFRLFLREFGLPIEYAESPYWVRREVFGDESIVDVEVAARGLFVIHIENKIWSGEGVDQTDREWADLHRRAVSLGIDPAVRADQVHALFLTPRGTRPTNPMFRPISWRQVIRVLKRFADQAQPPDVKLFARHYAKSIRTAILRDEIHREDRDGEPTSE
jgi:hypothetical protein